MRILREALDRIFYNKNVKEMDSFFLVSIALTLFFVLDLAFGRPITQLFSPFIYVEHLFAGFVITFWVFLIIYRIFEGSYDASNSFFFAIGFGLASFSIFEIVYNIIYNINMPNMVDSYLILSEVLQTFIGIIGALLVSFWLIYNQEDYFY